MFYQKIIFLWILVLSIFMGISSSFWFSLWVSLEINMMMFIPLMNSKNFLSSNSIMNYYIIQSFSSSLFLFSSFLTFFFSSYMMELVILITMMIKLGAAPFHVWFPQISEGMHFFSFFILLTFQKIIPLFISSLISHNFFIFFIISSSMIGSLGGLNQTSFKKILAFSSISHLAWMMALIFSNHNFWMLYLLIYSLITMKIIKIFKKNYNFSIFNYNSMKLTFFNKISMVSFFLSLGGMPPFLGFFSKWISVILMMKNFPLIMMILIPSSLINLFFYIRILYPVILNLNILMKPHQFFENFSKNWMFFPNFLSLIILIPLLMII
uniref:NADH dehydrogenase subunit 2 n=1 Tax=Ixodes scapularis TaxID=6945 RepID=UPI0022387E0F|nr:NADH dehydrogenase subunit 2 [Ixodes scapularis]UYB78132.1 NADH dehydrogenase subunit 2 [Ixodes scapularis]UYB78145.1 NADH dehydrogenase subunit 2 [Ixodes scapularis]